LAQGLIPHLGDARSAKSALQLTTILGTVKQTVTSTVAKDMNTGASTWEAVGGSITHLTEEASKLLPLVLENESVLKSACFFFFVASPVHDSDSAFSYRRGTLGNKDR
jgi:dynactin 1